MNGLIVALCGLVAATVPSAWHRPRTINGRVRPSRVHWSEPVRRVWTQLSRRRLRRRLIESIPEFLELVARGLRGGANLHGALADAAAVDGLANESLRPMLSRVDQGERLGEAVDRWAEQIGHGDADVVRAVLRLGHQTGGALADSLERAAATLSERTALADEIHALTAQARASSLVVALAPVGFLGVVSVVDPGSAAFLFTTSIGLVCLMSGLALDAIGILWMSRIAAAVSG